MKIAQSQSHGAQILLSMHKKW